MSKQGLTGREQEHLAVLRVSAMGHGPEVERIEVRRVDVLVLLMALDRLAQRPEPPVQAHESVSGAAAGAYFAAPQVTIWAGTTVILGKTGGD